MFIKVSRVEAVKVLRCCIMLFNKAQLVVVVSEVVGEGDRKKIVCFLNAKRHKKGKNILTL